MTQGCRRDSICASVSAFEGKRETAAEAFIAWKRSWA